MKKISVKNRYHIFSFFAGAGFLDLGFESVGLKIVFVNELNNSFLEAYKYSRSKMGLTKPKYGYDQGDMVELTKNNGKKTLANLLKESRKQGVLVGFIGGPPCPDFSAGGKNMGRNGHLGKLSETYITLIIQQKPDFFLFENVKGLWRNKKHREFYEELKKKLQKKDYVLTERLINSLEYGVPQDRERIVLVGFRKELIPLNLFDKDNGNILRDGIFPWSEFIKYPAAKLLGKYKEIENQYNEPMDKIPRGIPEDTTVEYWFNKNKVFKHPNSKHCFRPRQGLPRFIATKEGSIGGKSFKRLHRWRYSPTVAYGNNEVHLHPYENRRLSVAEAMALQSLPKNFEFPDSMTLSKMFKAISNGVPYKAAEGVAKSVRKFLNTL